MSDVPPGYKQTEVGIIPEDWEAKELSQVCIMRSGVGITSKNIAEVGLYPCYGGNGLRGYTATYTHDGNFVLIGRQGALCGNINLASGKFFASEHAVVVDSQRKADVVWLGSILSTLDLNSLSESSAQPGLAVGKIQKLPIPLPPLPEQRAIASALADVDALLASVEDLLTKKRQLKQAAMQELLTGKTRLEGFEGEWEEVRLGDVADMSSGGTPDSKNPALYGGGILWASIADMTNAGKHLEQTEKTLTQQGYQLSAARIFDPPVLLFAMYASIGKVCISNQSISSSQAILGIKSRKGTFLDFLYYWLTAKGEYLRTLGQQGTQANLNKGIVQDLEILLPPLPEQQAIAAILSDMDAEIDTLEQRLTKTRDLKQGMMQELLTGRTRLV